MHLCPIGHSGGFRISKRSTGIHLGGGCYIVGEENLGRISPDYWRASLLIDYVLTAAVRMTAGVEAIASAFPVLWDLPCGTCFIYFLALITLLDFKGIEESGTVMAIPVYTLLFTYGVMLVAGLVRALLKGWFHYPNPPRRLFSQFSLLIVIRAFTAGSTALTGIEAISNGVPVFKSPNSRNAGKTLIVMAFLMGFLFLSSSGLTQYFAVVAGSQETILSALTEKVVGRGFYYYLVQASTLLILTVAANTSFAGFPRITYLLACDGYLPCQLSNLGDRLVYLSMGCCYWVV